MLKAIKNNLAFIFLAVIFILTMYFSVSVSIASSEDRIVYLSPDTYKEMSTARTFAQGNGWGVSRGVLTPVNSVIYPVMLAGLYKIFGVKESIPLIVNIFFGFLIICLIWYFLRREQMWQISAMTTGFFIYLSSSMPLLIMQGNEKILMMAAALVFIYFSAETKVSAFRSLTLAVTSLILGAVSPEGLLVVISAVIILAARREFVLSAVLFIAAIIAPLTGLIFGFWNGYADFGILQPGKIAGILSQKEYLFPIAALTVTAIASAVSGGMNSKYASICRIVLAAILLKVMFMPEAGSMQSVLFSSAFAIFAVSIAGFSMFPDKPERNLKTGLILISSFMLYLTFLYPMIKRGVMAYSAIPDTSRNVYERSYRLGLFVKECCDKKGVVSDEAGAITYLADIDFIGIGKAGTPGKEASLALAIKNRNAVISIASEEDTEKYKKYFPGGSVKLREWVISMAGNKKETLVFYCLKPSEYGYLRAKLNNFSAYLPPDIKVR